MKTATLIAAPLENFQGGAALYRLTPEWVIPDYDDPNTVEVIEYVVVSAVVAYSGPETYIFAAMEDGTVTSWIDLPGSFQGGLDHEEALKGAGYQIVWDLPAPPRQIEG